MFSFLLFLWGIDEVKRRHVWMEVETCGNSWKVVKNILIFIHTPVISLSLASKPRYAENRTPCSLSSSVPLLPFWCRICSYFFLKKQANPICVKV